MIGYTMVGTQDLKRAKDFYNPLFQKLGARILMQFERSVFWGHDLKMPMFAVCYPYDKEAASVGNGTMIGLVVSTSELVKEVHAMAIQAGGINEGDPGERAPGFFVGYCRDLDGNKMAFYHHL